MISSMTREMDLVPKRRLDYGCQLGYEPWTWATRVRVAYKIIMTAVDKTFESLLATGRGPENGRGLHDTGHDRSGQVSYLCVIDGPCRDVVD